MAHDVFVSYSKKDKPTADAVCAVLESHGIRCWVAPRDILPGSDWGGSIIEAINGSRAMVLIFSANANTSQQIKREVERAVNKGIPVIPLRIEDVVPTASLEYFISTPHWLDAFTPPLEQHLQYLAEVVRKIVDRPEVTIPPSLPETESREKSEAEATRVAEEKRKAAEVARLAEEKRNVEEQEKKDAAERAKLAEEKQKVAEATRLAEEEAKLAEEKRKVAEEAERARLADEKKKAAGAVESEKHPEEQRKAALGKIAATDLTKKRSKAWLFVVGIVVLLCFGGAAAWYFKLFPQPKTPAAAAVAQNPQPATEPVAETPARPADEKSGKVPVAASEKVAIIAKLKELEDKMERWATTTRDVSSLASFIADDFVRTTETGTTQNKAQLLDDIRKDSDTYKFAANENLDVHLYSRTSAVVTGLAREKGTDKDGKPFDRSYRFTDTWIKRNGQWRCTANELRLL